MRFALVALLSVTLVRAQVDEATRVAVAEALRSVPTFRLGVSMSLQTQNGVPVLGMDTGEGIYVGTAIADREAKLAAGEDVATRLELARLYLIANRPRMVGEQARAVVAAIDPAATDDILRHQLAEAHLFLGEFEAAEAIATELQADDPDGPAAKLLARCIAARLTQSRDIQAALGGEVQKLFGLLTAYTTTHPDDPEPYLFLALARNMAPELVRELGAQAPPQLALEVPDIMWEAARRATREVEILITSAFMDAMMRYDRTPPEPRITRDSLVPRLPAEIVGRLEHIQGKLAALVDDADLQVASDAVLALGLIKMVVYADQAATDALVQAHVQRTPGDHPLWRMYGATLIRTGRYDELAALAEERAAQGDSCFLRTVLGKVHLQGGKLDDAAIEFDAAMELDATDWKPVAGQAAVELSRGDAPAVARARELTDWAAELAGERGADDARADLAALRCAGALLQGDVAAAREALGQVTGADPGEAIVKLRAILAREPMN